MTEEIKYSSEEAAYRDVVEKALAGEIQPESREVLYLDYHSDLYKRKVGETPSTECYVGILETFFGDSERPIYIRTEKVDNEIVSYSTSHDKKSLIDH